MKAEEPTSSSTTLATTPAVPATTYPTQWASTLQQQTASSQYYSYASHYGQTPYATHYQAYAPPVSAAAATPTSGQAKSALSYQTSTHNLGTTNSTSAGGSNNAMDTSDVATLNDALGSAGVDLRAEEESLQHSNASASSYPRTYEDRTRKQPLTGSAFDTHFLSATMRTIASNHKVTRVPDDAVAYLALCLRARLQDLVTAMVKAAKYRTDGFDRPAGFYEAVDGAEPTPMWSILVRNDVAKQLAALEKVEREEELRIRKERKELAEMQATHAAALAAQAGGGASNVGDLDGEDTEMGGPGGPKKKRKKEGPGVTARNMSEDVRKKMSNAVATQAAGLGGKYAWMTSANATGAGATKPKPGTSTTATTSATTATGSSWARPYVPAKKLGASGATTTASVSGVGAAAGMAGSGQAEFEEATVALTRLTMRDAMFVIDSERGHGGGRGSARGWT